MSDANLSVGQFFTNDDPTSHPSSSGEEIIAEKIDVEDANTFFEIEETINWIKEHNFQRIALQFPDSLLQYASYVSCRISGAIDGVKTFVLADTSYRGCCVDFVAAAHARCDSLIHYGNACLSSPSTEIPSRFVLGRLPCNVQECADSIAEKIDSSNVPIFLLSDASYDYILEDLLSILQKHFPTSTFFASKVALNSENKLEKDLVLGRIVPKELQEADDKLLIFVGAKDSSFLPIWLMTFPQISSVVSFDPKTNKGNSEKSFSVRQLRKRLFLVEKLKDANTVGLVVGTVGLEGHKEAVTRMRSLCKASGKKLYVISVGKVNVPKLSNFSDIDVFVLLSCPFGIILDTSDFFKPVISLFEAEVALNPSNSWAAGSGWTADFSNFLHDTIGESSEDGDVSLLTGRVRAKPTNTENEVESGQGQVAIYTAGDYFKQRSWRGLDDTVKTNEETTITEGRAGIAASYVSEPNK